MVNNEKVVIIPYFLKSFNKLSKNEQNQVRSTIHKNTYYQDLSGLRMHRLTKNKNFYSLSVNKNIRLITSIWQDKCVYLYVDHHNEAYKWADKHKVISDNKYIFEVLKETKKEELVQIEQDLSTLNKETYGYTVAINLIKIGISNEIAELIRFATSEDSLIDIIEDVSPWYQEIILNVATRGINNDITIKLSALKPNITILDDDQLKFALDYPLDKWRLFLHPSQQQVIGINPLNKLILVGGPGTGKTVTLLHRGVKLAEEGYTVLFVTKNEVLSRNIQDMLLKISDFKLHSLYIGYFMDGEKKTKCMYDLGVFLNQGKVAYFRNSNIYKIKFIDTNAEKKLEKNILFDHIIVDEAQDLTGSEELWILDLLKFEQLGITLSYNSNQAINSSKITNLSCYIKNNTDKVINLNYSYRLTKQILDYARSIAKLKDELCNSESISNITPYYKKDDYKSKLLAINNFEEHPKIFNLSGKEVSIQLCKNEELPLKIINIIDKLKLHYVESEIAVLIPYKNESIEVPKVSFHTYSNAKGLEWFVGIVVVDNKWLDQIYSRDIRISPMNILKLNRFYVAITRFREELHIIAVD